MAITEQQWNQRRGDLGRDEAPGNHRSVYERDRSRIIHSAVFRRLQGKTQVLGIGESDFHRTRLTHSMEVAQLARGIVQQLGGHFPGHAVSGLLNVDVIETISLAHDIGHPPFGHRGELVLDYLMDEWGGFEGNAQTLRDLTRDELHTWGHGLNPTRRVALGVLKYPVARRDLLPRAARSPIPATSVKSLSPDNWDVTKCYYDDDKPDIVNAFILGCFSDNDRSLLSAAKESDPGKPRKPLHKSLDSWIMDVADEIAYATHDIEDAISLKLISRDDWNAAGIPQLLQDWPRLKELDRHRPCIDNVSEYMFNKPDANFNRKLAIGHIIRAMVESVIIVDQGAFDEPLLRYKVELREPAERVRAALDKLKFDKVVKSTNVQTLEYGGQQIVAEVFEAICTQPQLLMPGRWTDGWNDQPERAQKRAVCSYVAGMTDAFVSRMHERLFSPSQRSVFERI